MWLSIRWGMKSTTTQTHCIAVFSVSAQNGACVVYWPSEFTGGFHQGRGSWRQKMPFCIVTFQNCTIFWHSQHLCQIA